MRVSCPQPERRDAPGPCLMKDVASYAHGSRGTIFTIGHSTRALSEFMDLLREAQIELLVDVTLSPALTHESAVQRRCFAGGLATAGIARVAQFRKALQD